jgi:hypothetical protein
MNELQFTTNQTKWKPHLEYMKEKGITITGFSETNTNWHFKNIKKHVTATSQTIFPQSSIAFSDNCFNPPDSSSHLPGGCMQLCTDHWMGRILGTIQDSRRMGRCTGQKFRLRDRKTLSIMTAYRPCQQTISDTNQPSTSVTYQQKLLFRKDKIEKAAPWQMFIHNLITEIQKIEKDPNNLVILMWDANEIIEDKSGNVQKLVAETTLVDTFTLIAGDPGKLPTYSRGTKRIDYMFTSNALVPYIKSGISSVLPIQH